MPRDIIDEVMDQMFIVHSPMVRRAIWHIIGDEFFCPMAPLFFYPSHLISIFLSNVMDIIQSLVMLHALAQKVIHPHFLDDNKLVMAMQ